MDMKATLQKEAEDSVQKKGQDDNLDCIEQYNVKRFGLDIEIGLEERPLFRLMFRRVKEMFLYWMVLLMALSFFLASQSRHSIQGSLAAVAECSSGPHGQTHAFRG